MQRIVKGCKRFKEMTGRRPLRTLLANLWPNLLTRLSSSLPCANPLIHYRLVAVEKLADKKYSHPLRCIIQPLTMRLYALHTQLNMTEIINELFGMIKNR